MIANLLLILAGFLLGLPTGIVWLWLANNWVSGRRPRR